MPWGVVYYRTADGRVPADEFLDRCPDKVEATILAVLEAVRRAPPPAFSGGGKWEALHGTMGGYYEIRVTGPGRRHGRSSRRDALEQATIGWRCVRGWLRSVQFASCAPHYGRTRTTGGPVDTRQPASLSPWVRALV